MNVNSDTIRAILEKHGCCPEWCAEYGEPGYNNSRNGILFANWNHIRRSTCDWLEHHGYSLEWEDEWIISYETNKAYRSSPDSYDWKPSYSIMDDSEIIGADEIHDGDYVDQYIEHLLNNPRRADTFNVDWTKHGFTLVNNEYEHGFHPGQTDDPKKILKDAQIKSPDCDFLFSIDSTGQFDMRFSIWSRKRED
jgi:hypothetical protein